MGIEDFAAYIEKLKEIDAPMQSVYYWYKQEIKTLLLETYTNQEDPYQQKWDERKRYYPHPILDATGNMKGSFKVRVSGNSFTISNEARNDNGIAYASYHQYGTQNLPVRKVIPDVEIPEQWKDRLEDYLLMKLQQYLEQ